MLKMVKTTLRTPFLLIFSYPYAKGRKSLKYHITWWLVFVYKLNYISFSNFHQSSVAWQMNSGACLCLCTLLKKSNLHWCLQAAMCNKWSLAGSPKQAASHQTFLHLKYGCTTIYDVDLVAANFTRAVKLMDCVIFIRIMNYPGSCQPDRSFISNKQPVNNDILILFKWFTSFIVSSQPKL